MSEEPPEWRKMSTPQQVMALQVNVKKMGLGTTLKKSISGELELEDLLEV